MTRWLLMRHAKSDWTNSMPDIERPLSERGERDCRAMGKWIADQGAVPDRVILSPANRTRMTLAGAMEAWKKSPSIEIVDAVYGGHSGTYLDALEGAEGETVMLLGHDPTMTDIVRHLAPEAPRTESGKTMPTGSVAIFEDGKLVALQWPKALS